MIARNVNESGTSSVRVSGRKTTFTRKDVTDVNQDCWTDFIKESIVRADLLHLSTHPGRNFGIAFWVACCAWGCDEKYKLITTNRTHIHAPTRDTCAHVQQQSALTMHALQALQLFHGMHFCVCVSDMCTATRAYDARTPTLADGQCHVFACHADTFRELQDTSVLPCALGRQADKRT